MLESGGEGPEPAAEDLAVAENLRPDNHFEPHTAVGRRLGGSSNLWAGRCVPFDAIDFRARPWLGLPAWPIDRTVLAPVPGAGARGARGGGGGLHVAARRGGGGPGVPLRHARALDERAAHPEAARAGAGERARPPGGATRDGDSAFAIARTAASPGSSSTSRRRAGGKSPPSRVVLAAGGNASTRLLLLEQAREPSLFGGAGGPLGRFYMGHLTGQIADIVFENAALHDGLDYHVDAHGSYVRRRLVPAEATQAAERLANVAFWPVVPRIADAAHRSGPLSAVFLALSLAPLGRRLIAEPMRLKHVGPPPYRRAAHLGNVVRDLPRTLGFAPAFLWRNRVAKMRLPGFFLRNPRPALRARVPCRAAAGPGKPADARARPATGSGSGGSGSTCAFGPDDAASVVRAHAALEALARPQPSRAARVLPGRPDGPDRGGARERQGRRAPGRDDPHGRRARAGGGRRAAAGSSAPPDSTWSRPRCCRPPARPTRR